MGVGIANFLAYAADLKKMGGSATMGVWCLTMKMNANMRDFLVGVGIVST